MIGQMLGSYAVPVQNYERASLIVHCIEFNVLQYLITVQHNIVAALVQCDTLFNAI